MKRGEVRYGVGNGLAGRRGVGNGLDRGHVGIVVDGVDMHACDVLAFQVLLLLLKAMSR